jgi:hypothetical protein
MRHFGQMDTFARSGSRHDLAHHAGGHSPARRGPAIAELHRPFAVQKAAFRADPYPDAAARAANLGALAGLVMGHRAQIRAAMSSDFGVHPELFTDLVEVLSVAGRAAYAVEQLGSWMAEEQRFTDPAFYGTATAGIRYQPKGVVGNIVPWNFPFDLSVGPLVEMLAAGNRVIIKPSDYTPACGELLRQMISETFPEDLVAVSVGGLALAKEFPTLRWDHLLYTGTKLIKNGQMCISVDTPSCPGARSTTSSRTLSRTRRTSSRASPRPAIAPASSPSANYPGRAGVGACPAGRIVPVCRWPGRQTTRR